MLKKDGENIQENAFRQKESTLVSANWPLNNWAQGTKSWPLKQTKGHNFIFSLKKDSNSIYLKSEIKPKQMPYSSFQSVKFSKQ